MDDSGKIRIPCEVYSRVVGYLRPVKQWNIGKQQEFKEREEYSQESFDAVVDEERATPSEELGEGGTGEVH